MLAGNQSESIEECNKRHINEMKETIKGWENELKFANTHKNTKYENYCKAMIKLCNNTLNHLQDDFKHLI